jgi:hypothetical protein
MSDVLKFPWPLPHLFLRMWDQLPVIFTLGTLHCSCVLYWIVHMALNAMNFNTLLAVRNVGCCAEHFPSCDGSCVSYRSFTSCFTSHQRLLQTPCLIPYGSHQDPPSYASVCFIMTAMCLLVICEHFKGIHLLCMWEPSHLPLYANGNPTLASGCDSSH